MLKRIIKWLRGENAKEPFKIRIIGQRIPSDQFKISDVPRGVMVTEFWDGNEHYFRVG